MFIQLTERFNNIFHNYLAAFKKGFGCVGAVIMGFSKALTVFRMTLYLQNLVRMASLLMHVTS